MNKTLHRLVRSVWEPLATRASGSYIAGPELEDAVRACRSFALQSRASTVCFWDGTDDTPDGTAKQYLAAIDEIGRSKLDCYISVKAPALGFSADLFRPAFDRAHAHGVGLHFDSMWPDSVDQTNALIRSLLPRHSMIGCTLPGRWKRSLDDAGPAAAMARVRVVKGQWADPQAPDINLRSGFLAVIDRLAGRARRVAVATHDPVTARAALVRLRETSTPCELELLLGLPARRVLGVAKDLNVPVRFYVPYGHAWLPYALRQAAKNPRIAWWVFKDMCTAVFRGSACA
jgi:proline dehydrogenase